MNFGEALEQLKEGKKITTYGWGDAYIRLKVPDDLSATNTVNMPYIYMVLESGQKVIWMPTHTEILDENWELKE